MVAKRIRFLGVRVTDAKYEQLLDRCDGKQLAVWMRETCLDTRPARSSRLPSMAPALLRQFAGAGNNLNQIARQINSGQWSVVSGQQDSAYGVGFGSSQP
ncbi:MobC family plasmid mobilization relaxosome protein (plasmid) [Klebsiella sp. WOUb02]|uniref:MobC family plasmid mobilization relaxosome protein n=1 Tax=Klebsiella sp. WOUb02 TaxID=3161071 RepID=UPI003D04F932